MLISDKQHQANRENAEKSTGPRTPTGKHSSSRNAIIHGALTATAEAVAELQAGFLDQYQPVTPHAQLLVHEFAACVRKLRRVRFGLPLEPNPNLVGDAYHRSVDTLESANEPQTAESKPLSQ